MKSIKRNLVYNTLLNISSVVFPLITAPYIARVLSPDDVGLFNFSHTYAGYFSLVATLGIPSYAIREISKVRDDRNKTQQLFTELFSLSILTTLIVSLLYLMSLVIIDQLNKNYVIFIVSGIVLYLTPLKIDWLFSGHEEFGFIAYRSIIVKILSVILLFVFVRSSEDLLWYISINVFSIVANQVWNCVVAAKKGISFYFIPSGIKKHLKSTLILFASTITTTIYTMFDTVMLGFMSSYDEVAYYNYANHISKLLVIGVTSLAAVALPRVSYYAGQGNNKEIEKLISRSFSFVAFLAFPISLGVILIGPTFVPLFLGVQYVQSSLLLQILSLIIIFIGFNNITGVQCLIGLGYEKLLLYSVMMGASVNFILNLILIPNLGGLGASIASVAAEGIVLFVSLYYLINRTSLKLHVSKDLLKSIAASLPFIPVYFFLKSFLSGWWLLFIFIASCSMLYLICQALMRNTSLEIVINTIKNKKNWIWTKKH